jgi:hypothetical protein
MSDKKQIEIFDDKLNGYKEVEGNSIKRFDHFFYSQNKYQEEGRKLVYGVCSSATKGRLTVNGYVPKGQEPEHDPWVIDVNNKYKEYRFYVKPVTDSKAVKPKKSKPGKPAPVDDELELEVESEEEPVKPPVKPARVKKVKA